MIKTYHTDPVVKLLWGFQFIQGDPRRVDRTFIAFYLSNTYMIILMLNYFRYFNNLNTR